MSETKYIVDGVRYEAVDSPDGNCDGCEIPDCERELRDLCFTLECTCGERDDGRDVVWKKMVKAPVSAPMNRVMDVDDSLQALEDDMSTEMLAAVSEKTEGSAAVIEALKKEIEAKDALIDNLTKQNALMERFIACMRKLIDTYINAPAW